MEKKILEILNQNAIMIGNGEVIQDLDFKETAKELNELFELQLKKEREEKEKLNKSLKKLFSALPDEKVLMDKYHKWYPEKEDDIKLGKVIEQVKNLIK